jgi:hypothetical protein
MSAQTTAPGLLDWLQGEWKSSEGQRVKWEKTDIEVLEGKFFTLEKSLEYFERVLILEYTEIGAYLIFSRDPNLSQAMRLISEEFLRESADFYAIESADEIKNIKIKRLGVDKMKINFVKKEGIVSESFVFYRYKR